MVSKSPTRAALFQPGQSGNPKGRPKGLRNKATVLMEALMDGEAEPLARKAIELALAGDVACLRLCMERLLPPRKDRPINFALPTIASTQDALTALSLLTDAVATGELTPSEAADIGKLVDQYVKATETLELERRLAELEERVNSKGMAA